MFKRNTGMIAATAIAGMLILSAAPSMAQMADIHLEPNLIDIGATYNGTEVTVSGNIPSDAEAVIQLTGEQQDTHLLKKGRVFGLLWMNTGNITLLNVPKAYMIYLPAAIPESALSREPLRQNLGIGFEMLKNKVVLTPAAEDKNFQFQEFIKLKSKEGLYRTTENAVSYQEGQNQMKSFTCVMTIPASIPQGVFSVTTYILKAGQVTEINRNQLRVKEVGLPAMIGALAFNHGLIYGILATLIALFAGWLTGMIFKRGGGH